MGANICPKCGHPQFWEGQHSDKDRCTHYVEALKAECGCAGVTSPCPGPEHKLKRCPFCGGNATLTNVRMSNHSYRIGCYNDSCWRPGTDSYSTAEAVVEAWNQRFRSAIAGELLEAV